MIWIHRWARLWRNESYGVDIRDFSTGKRTRAVSLGTWRNSSQLKPSLTGVPWQTLYLTCVHPMHVFPAWKRTTWYYEHWPLRFGSQSMVCIVCLVLVSMTDGDNVAPYHVFSRFFRFSSFSNSYRHDELGGRTKIWFLGNRNPFVVVVAVHIRSREPKWQQLC